MKFDKETRQLRVEVIEEVKQALGSDGKPSFTIKTTACFNRNGTCFIVIPADICGRCGVNFKRSLVLDVMPNANLMFVRNERIQ